MTVLLLFFGSVYSDNVHISGYEIDDSPITFDVPKLISEHITYIKEHDGCIITPEEVDSFRKRYLNSSLGYNSDNETCENMNNICLLYTSPSPRDLSTSRMPSSA